MNCERLCNAFTFSPSCRQRWRSSFKTCSLHLTPTEFTDDEGQIAKGSSVVVRRIPVVGARSSSNAKIRNMYVFLTFSAGSPTYHFSTLPLVVCVCICAAFRRLSRNVYCSDPEILLKAFALWWIFLCFIDIYTRFTSH